MSYNFLTKKKGDDLFHQEWNALTAESKRFSKMFPPRSIPEANTPPWAQFLAKVNSVADSDSNTFWCSLAFFDPNPNYDPGVSESIQGYWKTEEKEWLLDSAGVAVVSVGDILVVWWCSIRGAFLPVGASGKYFYNASGETIPPNAIMAVTGVETFGSIVIRKVAKPSTTFYREYLVNGSSEIVADFVGLYQDGPSVQVAYDTGTPANGEGWGPKPDQWTVSKNYPQTCLASGIIDAAAKTMHAKLKPITGFPFQLKTSLTPGGTATAYLTEPDGTIIDESTPLTVTVTDTIGDKRAVGKDDAGGGDGALGLAEVLADGTVAIKSIHQRAKRCSATLDDDVGFSDSTLTVNDVSPLDDGMDPSTDGTLGSVANPLHKVGAASAVCVIEADGSGGWQLADVAYVSQSVVTDEQIDDEDFLFQNKTRTAVGMFDGDEDAEWNDLHEGTDECPEE